MVGIAMYICRVKHGILAPVNGMNKRVDFKLLLA